MARRWKERLRASVTPFNAELCVTFSSRKPLFQSLCCAHVFVAVCTHFWGGWKKKICFYPRVLAPLDCESFTNVTTAALRLSFCGLFTPSEGGRCKKSSTAQVLNERRLDVKQHKHIPGNTEPYRVKTGREKGRPGELLNLSVSSLSCIAQSVI